MSEQNYDFFDLDTNLDDIPDLVQFVQPHDGTHVFGIVYAGEDKVGKEKRGIKIVYQLVRTIEKARPDEEEVPVGSLFNESFTNNDMGRKLLKLRIKQMFGEDITGSMRPYIDMLNKGTTQFMAKLTTKQVKSTVAKDDGSKQDYTNTRVMNAEAVEPLTDLPADWEWYDYTPEERDAPEIPG